MIKNIIFGMVTVGVLGGLLFLNGRTQTGSDESLTATKVSSTGTVSVVESNYDFGTISMRDGEVEHLFDLVNDSQEAVTLGEIYTSCMCTTAQAIYEDGEKSKTGGMRGHGARTILNKTIGPGETVQIKAVFDPAAHGPAGTGPASRTVYVATNSREKPVVELNFEAMVTR